MRLIYGLLLAFFMVGAYGVNTLQSAPYSVLQANTGGQEFPVIYGKKDDGFPDIVNLRGEITKVSFSHGCGFFRGGGVLQIKLTRSVPAYNSEHIYVAAPCIAPEGDEEYLGKAVCMSVKKMKPGDMCHATYISNSIDSKGVPFYCLSWHSGKPKEFLRQVACKTNE